MTDQLRQGLLCTLIILACALSCSAQCWRRQYPAFPTESLNDIRFITRSDCIAVGDGGLIARSADSGHTWLPLNYITYEHLQCLSFPSSATGWAGGTRGTLLRTTDSGYTWGQAPGFNDTNNITAISFRSTDTGYVAGDSCIWRTYNGGGTWTKYTIPNVSIWRLNYIKAFSRDTVYANYQDKLLRSYNNGQTWTSLTLPQYFTQMEFLTPRLGWAMYSNMYYKTTDGGLTWSLKLTLANSSGVDDMQVLDSNNVVATQNGNGTGSYTIISTGDGGQTWRRAPNSPYLVYATCLHFLTPTQGIVGNLYGGISTTDDGDSFTPRTNTGYGASDPAAGSSHMECVDFADSLHGIAGGAGNTWRTVNGGLTWGQGGLLPLNIIATKVTMTDSLHAWAVGWYKELLKTADGGVSWAMNMNASNCNDVKFYDTAFGMIATQSGVKATRNSGGSWSTVLNPAGAGFTKVTCTDSLHWIAFSTTALYKTSDAGATWTAAVPLAYPYAAPNDVAAFDTMRFYTATSMDVAKTTNGGASFSLTYPYSNSQRYYLSGPELSFYDSLHGMVASANWTGSYYLHATIMRTADGCSTWQNMSVPSRKAITGVSYKGSMKAWFCTTFGSIYSYYPSCPPAPSYPPLLTRSGYQGCGGQALTIRVANLGTYTAADTLTASLRQGNTVTQTLSVGQQGEINFTTPSAPGIYSLVVRVTGPGNAAGITRSMPVTIYASTVPRLNIWPATGFTDICSSDALSVGVSSPGNLGTGYSYQLRMLKRNGTDSLIAINQNATTLTGLQDTCRLYYKVYVGTGVCPTTPVFSTDTLTVNVVRPLVPSAHLSANAVNGAVCRGDSVSIVANAQNTGTSGRVFRFHKVVGTTDAVVQSGASPVLHIPSLPDTALFYADVFPGYGGGCINRDTFRSDSVRVSVVGISGLTATIRSNRPGNRVCSGDTIALSVSDNIPGTGRIYRFHAVTAGSDLVVQSDTLSIYTGAFNAAASVYCEVGQPAVYCAKAATDTISILIGQVPSQPVITAAGNMLTASGPAGATWQWYLDGVPLAGATNVSIIASQAGTYSVTVTSGGCTSMASAGFGLAPSGISIAARTVYNAYPNPVSRVLTINAHIALRSVSLYNQLGVVVFERSVAGPGAFTIDLASLPDGIYVLAASWGEGTVREIISKRGVD